MGSGSQGSARLLVLLPWLAVGAVAVAWLLLSGNAPSDGVRIYSGPSHPDRLSLRLVWIEERQGRQQQRAGCLSFSLGTVATETCSASGVFDVNVALPASATTMNPAANAMSYAVNTPTEPSERLLEGELTDIHPPPSAWPVVSRRGGWLSGDTKGELVLRVGLVQGVLAVPFPGALRVEVLDGAGVAANAELTLELSGADPVSQRAASDAHGVARFELTPREHAVHLTLNARLPGTERAGTWRGSLPVVPGASWASREGDALVVRSPIPRQMVFVDLAEERGVLHSASLQLQPEGDLHAARLPWREQFERATFAVISSEVDLQSMALVGWPLPKLGSSVPEVSSTWDARGRLLVDGVQQRTQARATRQRLWRRAAAWFVITLAGVEAALLFRVYRAAAPTRRGRIGFAVLAVCIVLGVAALCLLLW